MSERGGELWEKEKAAKVNESRCVRSGKRAGRGWGGGERARGGNRKNGWADTQAFCHANGRAQGNLEGSLLLTGSIPGCARQVGLMRLVTGRRRASRTISSLNCALYAFRRGCGPPAGLRGWRPMGCPRN